MAAPQRTSKRTKVLCFAVKVGSQDELGVADWERYFREAAIHQRFFIKNLGFWATAQTLKRFRFSLDNKNQKISKVALIQSISLKLPKRDAAVNVKYAFYSEKEHPTNLRGALGKVSKIDAAKPVTNEDK